MEKPFLGQPAAAQKIVEIIKTIHFKREMCTLPDDFLTLSIGNRLLKYLLPILSHVVKCILSHVVKCILSHVAERVFNVRLMHTFAFSK